MTFPKKSFYRRNWLVNGSIWEVRFARNMPDPKTVAICDPEQNLILIKLGQTREETFACFWHELLHAFEFEYDFEITERIYERDHAVVDKLERAVVIFFKENFIS